MARKVSESGNKVKLARQRETLLPCHWDSLKTNEIRDFPTISVHSNDATGFSYTTRFSYLVSHMFE